MMELMTQTNLLMLTYEMSNVKAKSLSLKRKLGSAFLFTATVILCPTMFAFRSLQDAESDIHSTSPSELNNFSFVTEYFGFLTSGVAIVLS